MKVKKLNSYKELSSTVADIVEEQIVEKVFQQLVLPTGSTPIGLYKELAKRNLNWSYVRTFNLDVYIMNPNHSQSYQTFMKENLGRFKM